MLQKLKTNKNKTNKADLEATSDTEKKSKKETISFRDRKVK